jgi:outer membrane protein assembly factor BamB
MRLLTRCAVSLLILGALATTLHAQSAQAILETAGVKGGLIVHLGCGDGKLTAALHASDSYLVHGLDADAANVEKARAHIRSLGLYGKVSVEQWSGKRLPYASNTVNLVVVENLGEVPMDEVTRVLAPLGTVSIKADGKWTHTAKPWPRDIDEWTHYLHGPDNNAVAKDTVAGPPRRLQWAAGPLWPRSHEYTPSISAMVSSGGRMFYIMDEGIRGIYAPPLPERWAVYARDAFSGVFLWRRPFPGWGPREWKDASHWGTPMSLPRRLVAAGDRVYVTLGYRAPVSALDARTGDIVRVYEQSANADEILCTGGVLLVRQRKEIPDYPKGATAWNVQASAKSNPLPPEEGAVVAIEADTGKVLWQRQEPRIVTLSLAALGGRVCYHTFEEIVCLDLRSGEPLWRAACKVWPDLTGTAGTLVMYGDVVLHAGDQGIEAFAAATGKRLWKGERSLSVAPRNPPDLMVAQGLVWGSMTAKMTGNTPLPRVESPNPAQPLTGMTARGFDPLTGQVKREIDIARLVTPGHHVRCYRSKGTESFLLWPKRGIEFVDIADGARNMRCDWARGECSYGVMPCNGLLYAPPHPCLCYVGVVLNGLNAYAAGRGSAPAAPAGPQLERGPAFGGTRPSSPAAPSSSDWPTYRHDPARSGFSPTTVPAQLKRAWQTKLGGRLSAPVIAEGRVFVAAVDAHALYALDAASGETAWSYTAGGRIDSPPAIHAGLVLFGCHDGWVYALRQSDGALAWRFRAAPEELRIVSLEQVESPWPVPGSVLVVKGAVYFAAGRSSYLDGGMYLYGLEPATGKVLHQAHLDGPWPNVAADVGRPYDMEGAKSDILTSDGASLYLGFNEFDLQLRRRLTPPVTDSGQRKVGLHLMALSGLLDDTWYDRMSWIYSRQWPGRVWNPDVPNSGQILVFDDKTTYALKAFAERGFMSLKFTPGRTGYTLRADNIDNPFWEQATGKKGKGGPNPQPGATQWLAKVPVRARAMALAGKTLLFAGPPDVVPDNDPYAAFEGRKGGNLWAVAAGDGAKLAEYPLESLPVFDGMAVANARLYISFQDGSVICMGRE